MAAYGLPVARPQPASRGDDEHPDDRALDRLADRGPSRVGLDGAMRARDVSRPAAADRVRAERTVTVKRARPVDS
jgi:hypothetical protein